MLACMAFYLVLSVAVGALRNQAPPSGAATAVGNVQAGLPAR